MMTRRTDAGQTIAAPVALHTAVEEYLHNFARRIMQDAVNEASSSYWIERAETFEKVGTPACDEIARACRHRAELALIVDNYRDEVFAALIAVDARGERGSA